MTRRQFGSIRKLPSGRYQARYRNPGGRMVAAPTTFTAKADAARFLATAEADLLRGDWRDPRLGRTTFQVWADRWQANTVHLRAKTQAGYESILRSRILPAFGERAIGSIDTPSVRAFVAGLSAAGVPAGTIVKARAVLSLVMATAIEGGAIKTNPCDGVKVSRPRRREMVFLTPSQVEDLAEAIARPPMRPNGGEHRRLTYPEYGVLVRLAAYTGLRAGEIAALRVGRVDLLAGRVDVVESLAEVPGRGLVFGPPKTYERRTVPIPRFLLDDLMTLVAGRPQDAMVFTAPDGGALRWVNFYRRHYRPAVERGGLPSRTRFHDLRHTCAALMIAQGAHPEAIKRRMGHSTITTTFDHYGHLFPELDERLTDQLDAVGRDAAPTKGGVVVALPVPSSCHDQGHGAVASGH